MVFNAPIAPVGYVRMTQQDRWRGLPGKKPARPVVVRWRRYADNLRTLALLSRFSLPDTGCDYFFELPMPESWSKKKKAELVGQPCQSKPDLDNLIKGVWDVLRPGDDCKIWEIGSAQKRWTAGRGSVSIVTQ